MSTPIKRDRAHFNVSQIVDAVRRGSLILSGPCTFGVISNILRGIPMPGVAFHRELDNALGTVKYTPLLGEECLVAVVAEALRIGQGKSHLSPDPLPGESIFSSEVNRFWHYVFDVDMLDGTLEEAKLAAEAIEKARR